MRQWFICFLILCAASPAAAAKCVDPAMLAHSTVSLTRMFGEGEGKEQVTGIRGTGWFLSARLIVTVAHVAEGMRLSSRQWSDLQVRERESNETIPVRLLRIVGAHAEKLAVLELKAPFPGATALPTRTEPLVPGERVIALGYPGGRFRRAEGRFVQFGADDRTAGAALLEMHDGDDRLVLDHGSSGAPVLDCAGSVVAVVANTFSQTLRFQSKVIRISTPWQSPNVASVPVDAIEGFSPYE